jgi:hypothetical protein
MKLIDGFVRFWTSLLLVLVLGGFAPIVLPQSTNADSGGTAAVVEPPIPGTFVPTKIPITEAEAYRYSIDLVYGFSVIIRNSSGEGTQMLVPRNRDLSIEQDIKTVVQNAVLTNVFDQSLEHTLIVTAEDWSRTSTHFNIRQIKYWHVEKSGLLNVSKLVEKIEVLWNPGYFRWVEMVMPQPESAVVIATNIASGAPVHLVAGRRDYATTKFYVEPAAWFGGAGLVGVPIGDFSELRGTLSITDKSFVVHHYSLPSGEFIESTVNRKMKIVAGPEEGRVTIEVYGKVGEYVIVTFGEQPEYMTEVLFPNHELFIPPSGVLRLRRTMFSSNGFFRVTHFENLEKLRLQTRQ